MLGNIPATNIYRNLHHYKEATRIPGFLILSIEAPINFANITYLHERLVSSLQIYRVCESFLAALDIVFPVIKPFIFVIRILRWIEEEEDTTTANSCLHFVILEMSGNSIFYSSSTLFVCKKGYPYTYTCNQKLIFMNDLIFEIFQL